MKKDSVRKIVSAAVLVLLCAATVAGLYLGIFGRTVDYADIHTETGDERQPLNRQVAFIPNTLNENWREAIRPAAKLAGGYSYTLTFDNADENVLKAASKVLSRRAGDFAGNADVAVKDGTVVVTVPENAYNSTLAAVFSPMGTIDFVLYGSDGNMSDPVLTSEHVKQAYYYNGGSSPQIQIVFNSKGAKAYNELRAANSGSMLYLRLDSQPVAYASLSALNSDMLAFTASDVTSAYITVSCVRSGFLPGAATLKDSGVAEASAGKTLDTLIIASAVFLAVIAVCLVVLARLSGLTAVWTMLAWIVVFFLLTSLIAVSANWIMTSLAMTVIVLCVCAFLYGLISLFGAMAVQIKHGRGAYAACADASRKVLKPMGILYGAVLLVGVLLMVIFKAATYGVLGRIVALSAIVSFVMVFAFPRLVLGCFAALTGKK